MNHRFAYLMAAGLALAAGPHAVMSASPLAIHRSWGCRHPRRRRSSTTLRA